MSNAKTVTNNVFGIRSARALEAQQRTEAGLARMKQMEAAQEAAVREVVEAEEVRAHAGILAEAGKAELARREARRADMRQAALDHLIAVAREPSTTFTEFRR